MDVGASFQFLVDALARDWYVIAPDWRGFGRSAWRADGYWFADYVADLDALLRRASRPTSRPTSPGTASAATSRCIYAGVRPERVAQRGFARRLRHSRRRSRTPRRKTREVARRAARSAGLRAVREPRRRSPTGCRRTIRACRATRREFLAAHWAEALPDGARACAPIRATSCRSRPSTGWRRCYAIWRNIAAPALWVAAADSDIPRGSRHRRRWRHRQVRRRAAPLRARSAAGAGDDRGCRAHAASRPAGSGGARRSKTFLDVMARRRFRAFAARRLCGARACSR